MTALKFLLTASLTGTLALICLIPGAAAAGENRIYKTVDADGNVVFTDIPPREDDQNAEQIIVEQPNSFAVGEAIPSSDQWIVEPGQTAGEEPPFRYNTLSIVSPADDEPVRENAGNVTIVSNVSPRLQSGHVIRLLMDGAVAQEGAQGTFNLANVDRGTHTIALEILDSNGNVLIRSDNSTFHLLRYAIRR
jgi:hypothetical protein